MFSALLNTRGMIGDLLLNSAPAFDFYSCQYLRHEIQRHWPKLLKLSCLSETDLRAAYERVLVTTRFVDEELAPPKSGGGPRSW